MQVFESICQASIAIFAYRTPFIGFVGKVQDKRQLNTLKPFPTMFIKKIKSRLNRNPHQF